MHKLINAFTITCVLCISVDSANAAPTSDTAFAYQGQLKQSGVPVTGSADFECVLFDAEVNGVRVAGPIYILDVMVASGLFTVELDFGAQIFDGTPLYLEVGVRSPHDPSDMMSYTPLIPRQHLGSVPYATHARGLLVDDQGNLDVIGDVHTTGTVAAGAFDSNSPLILQAQGVECARFVDGSCFFGVGTMTPQARLDIGGTPGVDGIMFPDGTLQTTAASGGGFSLPYSASFAGNDETALAVTQTGTGSAASFSINNPNSSWFSLFATSNGSSPALFATHSDGRTVAQFQNTVVSNSLPTLMAVSNGTGTAIVGTTAPAVDGSGVRGSAMGNGNGIEGRISGSGNAVDGQVTNNSGRAGYFEATSSSTSQNAVEIQSAGGPSSRALKVVATGTGRASEFIVDNPASFAAAIEAVNNASGIAGRFVIQNTTSTAPAVVAITDGIGSAGLFQNTNRASTAPALHVLTSGPGLALKVAGTARVDVLEIQGADLAEKFPFSGHAKPGMVVMIDADHPGQLCKSLGAYNRHVAGVVSGANGLMAGTILGHLPGSEDDLPVALSGRVWTFCDATQRAINPGDLLTTSDTTGYAMAVEEYSRAWGATIGKAMTPLPKGQKGLVLVLVNLQ